MALIQLQDQPESSGSKKIIPSTSESISEMTLSISKNDIMIEAMPIFKRIEKNQEKQKRILDNQKKYLSKWKEIGQKTVTDMECELKMNV